MACSDILSRREGFVGHPRRILGDILGPFREAFGHVHEGCPRFAKPASDLGARLPATRRGQEQGGTRPHGAPGDEPRYGSRVFILVSACHLLPPYPYLEQQSRHASGATLTV